MRKLQNSELNRLDTETFKLSEKTPIIVVLDNIRSLNNIGSVFRTADAFRIESIYLCGITAQPPHRDIHKTALGATESVDWQYFENTMEAMQKLTELNYSTYAIEQVEKSIFLDTFSLDKNKKYALVFGHEVRGVAQEVVDACDGAIEIPQIGTKHSLNISVSTGVVLWEFFRQFTSKNK